MIYVNFRIKNKTYILTIYDNDKMVYSVTNYIVHRERVKRTVRNVKNQLFKYIADNTCVDLEDNYNELHIYLNDRIGRVRGKLRKSNKNTICNVDIEILKDINEIEDYFLVRLL